MTPTSLNTESIPLIESPTPERSRGLGILTVAQTTAPVALPLAGVRVAARVAGHIAEVSVTETFRNPHAEALEAVYIFPLPGAAAVSDFEMRVGGRVVRGRVEERGRARQTYQRALEKGHRTALLEQERDDVFTVQLGNLPPGQEITVRIIYSERLSFFEDGTTELRLPTVVAPRYIPGHPVEEAPVGEGIEEDTDVVPDASRLSPPRLAPGFNPNVALGIEVEFFSTGAAGAAIILEDLSCSQHATRTTTAAGRIMVALARRDERLNRDFVLRWRLAGETIRPALLAYRDEQGIVYGMLSLAPPRREGFFGVARDVLFVLDRSGSMQGVKMISAARACARLLATLGPQDRFAIQAFDDRIEWLKPASEDGVDSYFQNAGEAAQERGEQFMRALDARGGTEMDAALGAALAALRERRQAGGRAPVVVLLTDGQVGDESRILRRIQQEIGDARIFTVGIDTAVNEGFLRRVASLGGGTATLVEPGAALEDALAAVGREIGNPLVVDLKLSDAEGGKIEPASLAPARIPDLFAGRAATVFFRWKNPGRVRVSGRFADGAPFEQTVEGTDIMLPAIAHLWARARVTDLEDRYRIEPQSQDALRKEIIDLSLRHALLTRFTAYMVVDESEVVNADGTRRKIIQPVEMPAQWEMEIAPAKMGGPLQTQSLMRPRVMPPSMPSSPGAAPPSGFYPMSASLDGAHGSEAMADASAPPKEARGGGVSDRFAGTLSHILGKAKKETASKKVAPKATAAVGAAEWERVARTLRALLAALSDAQTTLENGGIPVADSLENARTELMEALAASELGIKLAALQRFLRSALIEILALLKHPGVTAGTLSALLHKHVPALAEIRAEAERHGLKEKPGSQTGPFWSSSI